MRRGNVSLAAALALAATAVASRVDAYCQTSVCVFEGCDTATNDDCFYSGTICAPSGPSDCGTPLFWQAGCVGYSMQKDASAKVSLDDASVVFANAFASWQEASCATGPPTLTVERLGDVACDAVEYNRQAGNANTIMFRDETWPYQGQNNTLALTTLTFDLETGEIFDADMEINATIDLTLSDDDPGYDLASIATHEVGHFLGLAHSTVETSTMIAQYIPGSLELRDLDADDAAGICATYAEPSGGSCSTAPRRGLSGTCGGGVAEEGDGCAVAGLVGPRPRALDSWPLALALGLLRRRRRR